MAKLSRAALDMIEADVGLAAALIVAIVQPFGAPEPGAADLKTGIAAMAALLLGSCVVTLLLERRLPSSRAGAVAKWNGPVAALALIAGFVFLVLVASATAFEAPENVLLVLGLAVVANVYLLSALVWPAKPEPSQ